MQVEAMRQEELTGFRAHKEEFKVVFDVGARGNTEFIDIHPNCEYHLFEPQKRYADHLKEVTKDRLNVYVNQFGLSDEPAKAQRFYTNVESFQPHTWIESTYEGEDYDLHTVSEYCWIHKIPQIDFLKIDTEGFDYKILLGAKDMLEQNRIKYIQYEYWDGVQKFVDLLAEQYDMTFMCEDGKEYELNESCIQWIDQDRIPRGMGGDIFCKIKTWPWN